MQANNIARGITTGRRGFLGGSSAIALGMVLAGPLQARASGSRAAAAASDLTAVELPKVRWWWPGGAIDPAEVRREVNQLADAGFGGFEIADVRDSQEVPTDPATQGWASPAWIAGVEAALEAAVERCLIPDITLGAHWPTGVPGVIPDDDAASKEMVHGLVDLVGGASFSGPVPAPLQEKPSGELPINNENPPVTPRLIAVQAFPVAANGEALDATGMVDLTSEVAGGNLNWTAPSDGAWKILSFWMRGTAQIQNMFDRNKKASMLATPRPYVIDIYGKEAARVLTKFWDEHLLPERTRALMRQAGGSFFEDSLEVSAATNWTPDLLAEFEARRGYSLVPYLAALPAGRGSFPGEIGASLFDLDGVDNDRVRHDFDRTLAEMYNEYRVGMISEWAHGLGMNFRVQVVGSNVNSADAATYADIPEGDNSNDIHGWRAFAAGRDIGGHKLLSDEAATFVGGSAHVADWGDMLYMLQRDYAGGVNSVMIHGFSYADGPGATWPGFSAFGAAIGNDWGPRDPNWAVVNDITGYLGRVQRHLQTGRAVTDLAVVNRPLRSISLRSAGYTFQYPAMELFERDDALVRDDRLWPDGPAYKAVVLNNVDAADPVFAEKLLSFARAGLPVVIVGAAPASGRGYNDPAEQDRQVQSASSALLALGNVRQVEHSSMLADALADLGVAPSFDFSSDARFIGLRRQEGSANLYYILNDEEHEVCQTVGFTGSGNLYRVNPWSGDATPVFGAVRNGDRVSTDVRLAKSEVALFVVSETAPAGLVAPADVSATRQAISLDDWSLTVEDWGPGPSVTTTTKTNIAIGKTALVPWSQMAAVESSSGVGTYTTQLELPRSSKGKPAELSLGEVGGTARVFVNGTQAAAVNVWTGKVEVGSLLRAGANTIEVIVATPLNNRLKVEGIESSFGPPPGAGGEGGEGGGEPAPPPMMFPEAAEPAHPDEVDGPAGGPGMQAGASSPGGKRSLQPYGLLGPVTLILG